MTLTPRHVRELLDEHGLSPSRALGQNFVADPNTVRRIARLSGVGPGDRVVEIGAGLGSLTLALAEAGAAVTAVEVDRHLVPVLRQVVADLDVRVVEGDALTLDWDQLLGRDAVLDGPVPVGDDVPSGGGALGGASAAAPWALVANLPYNVATPLVLDLLDEVPALATMLVMVQREVGERLAAPAGSRTYGIPSVKVAYWAHAEVVGRVPPAVFVPQPRVESVLVRITRRPEPAVAADRDTLFELVRSGFGQRRKMLRRSLAGVVAPEAFEVAGVDPAARPEELDVHAWGALADAARGRS